MLLLQTGKVMLPDMFFLVRPPPLLLKQSLKNSFSVHISFSMALIRLLV